MLVFAFDLSSACIGLTVAELQDKTTLKRVKSTPIIPPEYDPQELGFRKTKKAFAVKDGQTIKSYYRDGETSISQKEKRHRDALVRTHKNDFVKREIGRQISSIIRALNPDLILVEKNSIFNGVLTSVLLGEIMGILEGIASSYGIPVIKYPVGQARAPHNVSRLVREFSQRKTAEELQRVKDVAKAALRDKMEQKYGALGFSPQTDDEGDSCVIFDYWWEHVHRKGKTDVKSL